MTRAARYGGGWMPHPWDAPSFADKIRESGELAAAAGRGPLPVTLFKVAPQPARVEQYLKDGTARCLFRLPPAGRDEVLPEPDRLAELIGHYK